MLSKELYKLQDIRALDVEEQYTFVSAKLNDKGLIKIKALDKRKTARPVGNKSNPRVITLPQPIASLACSDLLEAIHEKYLGKWTPDEVLLVYAIDQSKEAYEKLRNDDEMYVRYHNAVMMGNLQSPLIYEAYIGFIKLGRRLSDYYRKIEIVGAELLDTPSDIIPHHQALYRTHIAKFRNIRLEDGFIKIPVSEIYWDSFIANKFMFLYWEKNFSGLTMRTNQFDYLFYSQKAQKQFSPTVQKEGEISPCAIYEGKYKDYHVLCFDLTRLVEKKSNTSSFAIMQKITWRLDWTCVTFKQGYFVVSPPSDGSVKFKPQPVSVPGVVESYNYLKEYLNNRLQPVLCSVKEMKLTIYDTIRLNEAIQTFAKAARQRGLASRKPINQNKEIVPDKMSFAQAISKAKQMTPEEFQKYKSEYIDFLVRFQDEKYKVIPCVERMAHSIGDKTEYAFLFSIECSNHDIILVVHENVNPDRSTIIFYVEKEDYPNSIREIYEFMQSSEINKRSCIRGKNIEIENDGILHYRSINHENFHSWKGVIVDNVFNSVHYKHRSTLPKQRENHEDHTKTSINKAFRLLKSNRYWKTGLSKALAQVGIYSRSNFDKKTFFGLVPKNIKRDKKEENGRLGIWKTKTTMDAQGNLKKETVFQPCYSFSVADLLEMLAQNGIDARLKKETEL